MTTDGTTVFVSYAHADMAVARDVAAGLTGRGYRVWIDEGELKVGDSIIDAISDAIGKVDFLIAFVSTVSSGSTWCRKELSLAMSGEVNAVGITVLPVRLAGATMPPSLADKLYLDAERLDADAITDRLDRDMVRHLKPADPLPPRRARPRRVPGAAPGSGHGPVRIVGVDTANVSRPRNDGTRGSALYRVPLLLDPKPSHEWAQLMVRNWDMPPSFTTMHRPGIGSVVGDSFVLDGTTLDEVERHHLDTLKGAVRVTNEQYAQFVAAREAEDQRRRRDEADHDDAVQQAAERLRARFE